MEVRKYARRHAGGGGVPHAGAYPLGLDWEELTDLVSPLVAAPALVGISIADCNPERDPVGVHANRVVELLETLLAAPGGRRA